MALVRQHMENAIGRAYLAYMPKRSVRPDVNETAFRVVQESTREQLLPKRKRKNPAAVALGRKGGLKGGKARARNLSAERLSEIGRLGAQKRWKKNSDH